MATDGTLFDERIVNEAKEKMIKDEEIYDISDFFKLFGDSTRLKIIWALDKNRLSVGDICNVLNITKSAASHQLNLLKSNKIVKFERVGKNIFYTLDDDHVSKLIETAREHLREK